MKDNQQFPNVIHLGKKSRKEIKKYKKGIGTMFTEVQQLLEKAKANAAPGEDVIPMVAIHKRKMKKGAYPGTPNYPIFNN
jgi:DNA primase catalytic subunit